MLAELDEDERKSICHIIDIAINKKRLKDNLSSALKMS